MIRRRPLSCQASAPGPALRRRSEYPTRTGSTVPSAVTPQDELSPLRDLGCDLRGSSARIFVLPDTDDTPSFRRQQTVSLRVSFTVTSNLFRPVSCIRGRHGMVLRASVPETPVQKNRHLDPGEHQIRRPTKSRKRPPRNTVAKAQRMNGTAKCELRLGVAPLVRSHALADTWAGGLGRAKVRHGHHVTTCRSGRSTRRLSTPLQFLSESSSSSDGIPRPMAAQRTCIPSLGGTAFPIC